MRVFISIFIATIILSCGSGLTEKVISEYPTGLPMKKEFYKETDGVEVKVKEIRFYPNGEKEEEGNYENEQKNGIWTQWYSNGEKWIEETYSEGVKHGKFSVWYQTGKKNYEGSYNMGMPSGEWIFWDADGVISKKTTY